MATTINADNGAVSGSAGLKYSSDSSGVLALQTNGTTAVSISTGQVVTFANPPTGVFPSGTALLFQQTTAPTGWTKSTTHDNKALRVVSGSASSGGSVGFTTAFASQAVSGTVGDTTLTTAQMPSHAHTTNSFGCAASASGNIDSNGFVTGTATADRQGGSRGIQNTGGGTAHNHSFTGTAINLAVQYVDVIIATKD